MQERHARREGRAETVANEELHESTLELLRTCAINWQGVCIVERSTNPRQRDGFISRESRPATGLKRGLRAAL